MTCRECDQPTAPLWPYDRCEKHATKAFREAVEADRRAPVTDAPPGARPSYADALLEAERIGHAAAAFRHLISPPEFSTPPTHTMVEAYREEIATFLRCGGTITLREWCLMPEVLRDAAIRASAAVAAEVGDETRKALDRMEGALPK